MQNRDRIRRGPRPARPARPAKPTMPGRAAPAPDQATMFRADVAETWAQVCKLIGEDKCGEALMLYTGAILRKHTKHSVGLNMLPDKAKQMLATDPEMKYACLFMPATRWMHDAYPEMSAKLWPDIWTN